MNLFVAALRSAWACPLACDALRDEGLCPHGELEDRLLDVRYRGRARIELLEIVGRGLQIGDVSANRRRRCWL